MKTGPRDSKIDKRQALMSERELFTDVAVTLRRNLAADAVAVVNMDAYQLFVRRASSAADRHHNKEVTKSIVRRTWSPTSFWESLGQRTWSP